MKKFIIFISCILCWTCSQDTQNQNIEEEILTTRYIAGNGFFYTNCPESPAIKSWDYPIKPGTEAWVQLKTHEAMVNACQIPDNILSSLSTKALTDICLQYPLLSNILAFNDLNDGINTLFDEFNGVRELFEREEASKELLDRYNCQIQNLSLLDDETSSELNKGGFLLTISKMESLLSRANENYKEILQGLVSGYEQKTDYQEYFQGLAHNFFARAHIIKKMCRECIEELPQQDKNAIFGGMFLDEQTAAIINQLSYQLIQ